MPEAADPDPGSPVRQAALLVHALGPADRSWLLACLDGHARHALAQPLRELDALGIPRDPRWLRAALERARGPAAPAEPVDALQHLSTLQVEALAAALEREPPELAVRLLALREWPWRLALRTHWSADMRRAVDAIGSVPPATALDAALCELAWRCVSANLGTRARTRGGPWPTLLRLVRRLGREGRST